ncbi:LacI family DNA-binding transcriptional regulator [Aerococcus suis]
MATLIEVANQAGVSKSTVSRYFNNGQVSEQARNKIEAAIKQTGYQPNKMARSLKATSSHLIGVIIPRFESPAVGQMLKGIDKIATQYHQQLLIINTNQDVKRELQALDTLASQRVDGIVNLTQNQADTLLQKQLKLDIPQIIMGQPYQELSYVAFDDYQSGAQLTEAIAEKGHQKITYIGVDETDYAVGQLRKQGVLSAAKAKRIQVDIIQSTFNQQDNLPLARKVIEETTSTAILCATDQMALAFARAIGEANKQIPNDIAIAGFGGYQEGQLLHPNLTTMAYPYEQAGELAIQYLNQLVNNKSEHPIQELLMPQWIEGESL